MTEDEAKPYEKPIPHWYPETRTVIVCWMMVSSWIIIMSLLAWGGPKGESAQLLNTLLGIYVGTGLVTAVNWWMGSSKGSDANNKMQDKLADSIQPAAPRPAVVVVSWWSLMEPDEKTAIEERAKTDAKIKTVYEALLSGKALPPDIVALVDAGLLKQERAANFKAA